MSEMKTLMEGWRGYVNESATPGDELAQNLIANVQNDRDWET